MISVWKKTIITIIPKTTAILFKQLYSLNNTCFNREIYVSVSTKLQVYISAKSSKLKLILISLYVSASIFHFFKENKGYAKKKKKNSVMNINSQSSFSQHQLYLESFFFPQKLE